MPQARIESGLPQGARCFEMRQSRYIGLARTHLQQILVAVLMNVVRVVAWLWSEAGGDRKRLPGWLALLTPPAQPAMGNSCWSTARLPNRVCFGLVSRPSGLGQRLIAPRVIGLDQSYFVAIWSAGRRSRARPSLPSLANTDGRRVHASGRRHHRRRRALLRRAASVTVAGLQAIDAYIVEPGLEACAAH